MWDIKQAWRSMEDWDVVRKKNTGTGQLDQHMKQICIQTQRHAENTRFQNKATEAFDTKISPFTSASIQTNAFLPSLPLDSFFSSFFLFPWL